MIKTTTSVTTSKPKAKAKAETAKAKPKAEPKKKPARGKKKPASKASPPVAPKPAPKPEPAPQPKPADGHRGGATPKLTEKDLPRVIETLRQYGGIKSVAADKLNVGRTTLYAFLNQHSAALEAAAEIDDEIKDIAEGKVIMAIRAGDMLTIRWYLELKAKDRGYVRRVENTGKDGGPVETLQKLDLSKLSDEELEILTNAAQRRESGPTQG
ncbi:helix-turn-helix domain-containing protein [Mesorhizobium sp. AA23]|uniref:helix-turn-helix domain-containing protein n=1 Tax=Mesorhizobium sp. AA23 TaxID=1854058 RepID=UPI000800256E|nr:helix-turn-helix domain-containing protein [Mesorhizobium sp. AA23]OBQ90009.1 hypothetical protein A9K66_15295 [Mesorhizobium sp. AA23]